MSQSEFASIFENAAGLVIARCGDSPEVRKVLDNFRGRITNGVLEPLKNRKLIIEPLHAAQVIGVPVEVVEKIAGEFHNLTVLHIWARAICPNSDEDECTIVETGNETEFKNALASSCPHCAQMHVELDWDHIEWFYAFHFSAKPGKLRLSHLVRRQQSHLPSLSTNVTKIGGERRSWMGFFATWSSFFFGKGPQLLLNR